MNVHLIRTKGVEDTVYFGVRDFLQHFKGPYHFQVTGKPQEPGIEDEVRIMFPDDPAFDTKKVRHPAEVHYHRISEVRMLSWEDLFSTCSLYRKRRKIADEDIVILLTEYGNYENWFSGYDEKFHGNYFVHTENWEHYTGTDPRYPIAYQITSVLLKHDMFENFGEMMSAVHQVTRGCMMDLCENKKQVSIKMRTADLCGACQLILKEKGVPLQRIKYVTDVWEFIRDKIMFRNRYNHLKAEIHLLIKGYMHHLYIPEMGMLQIDLTPLERAVYLLFLNHAEGIRISEFQLHRAELSEIIHRISRNSSKEAIEKGINELCKPESNSLSEKMARIRKKFTDHLGEQMAQYYIIQGPNGGLKTIRLDRNQIRRETKLTNDPTSV